MQSTDTAKFWMELCQLQMDCDFVALKTQDFDKLKFLEQSGYILTTDTDEYILVRVFIQTDETGPFFCTGKCLEEQKNE